MGVKGQFFTIDAILALVLIVITFITISNFSVYENPTDQLEFYSKDIINVLNNMQINNTGNNYINNLIASRDILELDNSVIEQIAIFWVKNDTEKANLIFKELTTDILPADTNYGLFLDEEEIFISSNTEIKQLIKSQKSITGIEKNKPIKGYIAKASLSTINDYIQESQLFFGGYIGDGNISFFMDVPEESDSITNVLFEFDTNNDFSIYINDIFVKDYSKDDFYYNIPEDKLNTLNKGQNQIDIKFNKMGYIAGGLFTIQYNLSNIYYTPNIKTKQYFSGISGFINYYSGINTKDILDMNINLHINSVYNTKLIIGNITVYENNPHGEAIIDITNNELLSKLDYSKLSNNTIPIRLSIGNITETKKEYADIVLVSDLSGSMEFCTNEVSSYATNMQYVSHFGYPDKSGDDACGRKWIRTGSCQDNAPRRIDIAKSASIGFVTDILEEENNAVGLVEYSAQYSKYTNYVQQPCGTNIVEFPNGIVGNIGLNNNISLLTKHINDMDSWYGTCICCGIIDAIENIKDSNNNKYIVVMSDGEANVGCFSNNARNDAITAANDACNNNISVYTVGFGSSVDKTTLEQMTCNDGKYFDASNSSSLSEIYSSIAENIANISYNKQTVATNFTYNKTILYPDSYIEVVNKNEINHKGILFNIKSEPFNNDISEKTINIPLGLDLKKIGVTSYSDDMWTKHITIENSINTKKVFDIDTFNQEYINIGDIFYSEFSPELIIKGEDNKLTIKLGTNKNEESGGSFRNRIFYDVIYHPITQYTEILPNNEGCTWQLEFEDNSQTTIKIPKDYTGTKICDFKQGVYDKKDATDTATYMLLKTLDFDNDGLIYFNIETLKIDINPTQLSGIPSLFGPTISEVRVWR